MKNVTRLIILSTMAVVIIHSQAIAQYKLMLQFHDMSPHVGQMLSIRVVDQASGFSVGHSIIPAISGPDFDVEMYVMIPGHNYHIDFYADLNGNGMYDTPPADHAWRLLLTNVVGDTSLSFIHDIVFTDVAFPPLSDIANYAGVWTGRWWNRTYSTTDSITLAVNVNPDSMKIQGAATTAGAFGNPQTVTFPFEGFYSANPESLSIALPSPWTGDVVFSGGNITGAVSDPTLFGVGLTLNFVGTYGESQAILEYNMSGIFTANGIMLLKKQIPTSLHTIDTARRPISIRLDQNYPNPFNPNTTISYQLSDDSDVTLDIYNIAGQRICTLVQGIQNAGSYMAEWNGRDDAGSLVSSGTYLYHLTVGDQAVTKEMMFLK
ncbi:T9SS type A sorting domain-containing protein [candidate division KSB1 bacterium]|nr:T9SS type A sorting domain-containing protein [candidate division KSB1 bacterium]